DRDLVELHREARARAADRLHAALERRQLDRVDPLGAEEHRRAQQQHGEACGEEDGERCWDVRFEAQGVGSPGGTRRIIYSDADRGSTRGSDRSTQIPSWALRSASSKANSMWS